MKKLLPILLVLLLASCSRNTTVTDNDAPIITIDEYNEVYYTEESVPFYTATCRDDIDETCTVQTPNYPDVSQPGTHTVTFKATDQAGNTSYETITITSIDRSSYITLNIGEYLSTVEVGDHYNLPVVSCTSTESDTCVVSMVTSLDTSTPNESYKLEITGTDSANNAKTVIIDLSILDTTNPEIDLVGDDNVTVELGAWEDPGVTTFDETTVTVTTEYDQDPETVLVGTFVITYTATDTSGNTSTITRTMVREDTTVPTVTLIGEDTVTVELGDTWEDPGLEVADLQATTTVQDVTPDTNALGQYLITYTITDASNNITTATRTVNVVDTTAPVVTIAGPDQITVELGDAWPTIEVSTVEIQSEVIVNTTDPMYDNTVGVYVQTVTSTDASGNVGSASRTVTVIDTTDPTITLVGDATINLNVGDTWSDPGVTTDDLSTVTVTQDITPDLNTAGTYVITYTAEDASGNTNTVQRTVVVN